MSTKYPLGTDREELERLHLQHRLWSDAAHAVWRRAGIAPGSHVLDVGAGPGAAAVDLAQLVTSKGRVLAVDESASFVEHIRREATERGLTQLESAVGDAHRLESVVTARPASFDLAYVRWLLCFTSRPEEVVRGVAALLKPGGAVCVHDYFNYELMTAAPRRDSYTRMVSETARSWRDNGGDPDVVAKLPRVFHEAGLELVHLDVHQRLARPGETMWHWATSWWRSYGPKLVERNYITASQLEGFYADVAAMKRETDFLVLPPVFELLARKRPS